jgi:hypothetical protein
MTGNEPEIDIFTNLADIQIDQTRVPNLDTNVSPETIAGPDSTEKYDSLYYEDLLNRFRSTKSYSQETLNDETITQMEGDETIAVSNEENYEPQGKYHGNGLLFLTQVAEEQLCSFRVSGDFTEQKTKGIKRDPLDHERKLKLNAGLQFLIIQKQQDGSVQRRLR